MARSREYRTPAITTLTRRKLREGEDHWLMLVSGAVMTGLGLTLWIRPDLLS